MASTSNENKGMRLIYGDLNLGVAGEDFHYIFSYGKGGPDSLFAGGREWVYRTPKPTFWRAMTDNDKGCQFPFRSGLWLGADTFLPCTNRQLFVDGKEEAGFFGPDNNRFTNAEYAENVKLIFYFEPIITPKTTVTVTYDIDASGAIKVSMHYTGTQGLPQLPAFGWRLIMPTTAKGFTYEGLSGETYPDRMAGGIPGVYEVEGLPVTPYLVPQECGMHMQTKWLKICRDTSLDVSKDAPAGYMKIEATDETGFNFSCLPYTAQELENATHIEELPLPRRTVLRVDGPVRGVGGIDSWLTDVEEAYHIRAEEDIDYSFVISFEQ